MPSSLAVTRLPHPCAHRAFFPESISLQRIQGYCLDCARQVGVAHLTALDVRLLLHARGELPPEGMAQGCLPFPSQEDEIINPSILMLDQEPWMFQEDSNSRGLPDSDG